MQPLCCRRVLEPEVEGVPPQTPTSRAHNGGGSPRNPGISSQGSCRAESRESFLRCGEGTGLKQLVVQIGMALYHQAPSLNVPVRDPTMRCAKRRLEAVCLVFRVSSSRNLVGSQILTSCCDSGAVRVIQKLSGTRVLTSYFGLCERILSSWFCTVRFLSDWFRS